jgi:hypothetical protein
MGWTDSHGRPELVMHPDIKRGVAFHRLETPQAGESAEKKPPAKGRKPRKKQLPAAE